MVKFKLLFIAISVMLFLWVMAVAVMAQEEVLSSYAGLKNPFPWSDASAQEAGKELYKQSCLGCHGIDGSNIAGSDFSATDYPQRLEESGQSMDQCAHSWRGDAGEYFLRSTRRLWR